MANPKIILEGDAALLEQAVAKAGARLENFQKSLPTKSLGIAKEAVAALGLTLGGGTFIAAISNAISALDRLDEKAQSAGVSSVEALQGLRYGASFAGVEADILQKSLEGLASKLADAAAGGKDSIAVFQSMGISFKNTSGQLLTTDEALGKIANKFAGYRDGAEKTALAADLFGQKIGPKLIPFLNQGADGIERLKQEAEKMGLVIGGPAVKAAAELSDQMDRLRLQTEGAWTALASKLVPSISKAIEEFEAAKRAAGGFAGALGLLISQSAETLEDPGKKLVELADNVAYYRQQITALEGYGAQANAAAIKTFQERIKNTEVEIGFLKELQRNRALANAGEAGDQVSRGAGRLGTAPGGKAKDEPNDSRALEQIENLKKQIDRNLQLTEIEKVRLKIVEGGYGKISPLLQEYLQLLAQQADITELGRKATEEAEKAREEEAKVAADADAGLTAYMQDYYSGISQRLAALKDELKTEAELENDRISARLETLQQARESDKINEEQYFALSQAAAADHELRITEIQDAELKRRFGISQVYRKMDLDAAGYTLKSIAVLMNTNSRTQFEIGKAAAIGAAIVDTYKAATGAYAALASIPYAGPYLGAAAAAAAIAAGIANVAKIKSTPFGGGGGGTAAVPATPSSSGALSPTSGSSQELPVQPQFAQAPRRIDITLQGSTFSPEQVRALIEKINEQGDFGAEINISRG